MLVFVGDHHKEKLGKIFIYTSDPLIVFVIINRIFFVIDLNSSAFEPGGPSIKSQAPGGVTPLGAGLHLIKWVDRP